VIVLAAPLVVADETSGPLSTLTSGDRVRLRLAGSGKSLRATIESVTADELVLRPLDSAKPLRLSLAQLRSLEVARGRRSQWRSGALIGFIPGALFFGWVGAALACIDFTECPSSQWGDGALVGGLVGGVATASVGALVGLAFKTDRWVRVHERKPKLALMVAPANGQVRVGLSVSF
jgi:hypothetical protein